MLSKGNTPLSPDIKRVQDSLRLEPIRKDDRVRIHFATRPRPHASLGDLLDGVVVDELHVLIVQTGIVIRVHDLAFAPDLRRRRQRRVVLRRRRALHVLDALARQGLADLTAAGDVEPGEVVLHERVQVEPVQTHGQRHVAHRPLEGRRVHRVGPLGDPVRLPAELDDFPGLASCLAVVGVAVGAVGQNGDELSSTASIA